MSPRALWLLPALAALGCQNTARSAREDAKNAAEDVRKAVQEAARDAQDAAKDAQKAADEAKQDVREAMDDSRDALRDAGREMRDAGRDAGREMRQAGRELSQAKQVIDVRAALAVSSEISSASDIDVRSDEAGRRLYLEGTTPTAAEKAAAERIAREKADGFRVENRLRVRPRP